MAKDITNTAPEQVTGSDHFNNSEIINKTTNSEDKPPSSNIVLDNPIITERAVTLYYCQGKTLKT